MLWTPSSEAAFADANWVLDIRFLGIPILFQGKISAKLILSGPRSVNGDRPSTDSLLAPTVCKAILLTTSPYAQLKGIASIGRLSLHFYFRGLFVIFLRTSIMSERTRLDSDPESDASSGDERQKPPTLKDACNARR